MSTLTNKIKNIFGASNNTSYTSTGTTISTNGATTGTINVNTSGANTGILTGASTTATGILNNPYTLGGSYTNITSSGYTDPELSLSDAKLHHSYKDGEQFYQHEILVTRIHRDKDNKIIKSEIISQYWIGNPSKEKIEYKNLSTEDRPEVELVIRTLRTIQL